MFHREDCWSNLLQFSVQHKYYLVLQSTVESIHNRLFKSNIFISLYCQIIFTLYLITYCIWTLKPQLFKFVCAITFISSCFTSVKLKFNCPREAILTYKKYIYIDMAYVLALDLLNPFQCYIS